MHCASVLQVAPHALALAHTYGAHSEEEDALHVLETITRKRGFAIRASAGFDG